MNAPQPDEREALTPDERNLLAKAVVEDFAQDAQSWVRAYGMGVLDRSRCDRLVLPAVERILAARRTPQPRTDTDLRERVDQHCASIGRYKAAQSAFADEGLPPKVSGPILSALRRDLNDDLTALIASGVVVDPAEVEQDTLRRGWDEALRWVRQQADVTSPEYVLDRIDRAEPFNPYRATPVLADAPDEVEWAPGRWYRVTLPDGTLWCETSDRDEAIKAHQEKPGATLHRLWEYSDVEWREDID